MMKKSYLLGYNNSKLVDFLDEWFRTDLSFKIIDRNLIPVSFPKTVSFGVCGVRRSGKTYSLFEYARILRKKVPLYNVIYINFDDVRLSPLNIQEFIYLPEIIKENFNIDEKKNFYLLLDEIQYIEGWEKIVRSFLDRKLGNVVFTGSSSKISPEKLSSSMRGRTLTKFIYPLNFKEFLKFKNFESDSKVSPKRLIEFMREFLLYGGFPEVVLNDDKSFKTSYLRELYKTIFYRDIIENFPIRNLKTFEIFLKVLLESFSSSMSISKFHKFLNNTFGIKTKKNTLQEYFFYIKSAFFIFEIEIFSYKLKERLQYPRKIYCIDTGLVNSLVFKFSRNWGKLLENAVFLELIKRGEELYYWKDNTGKEVDFILMKNFKPQLPIQVVWNIDDEKTKGREIRALLKAMEEFELKEGLIITGNFEGKDEIGNKRIIYKPFWKWAL